MNETFVRLVVCAKGPRSTPSIYLSIMIAYLEQGKWQEAQATSQLIQSMSLLSEENLAFQYLNQLMLQKDEMGIMHLTQVLTT